MNFYVHSSVLLDHVDLRLVHNNNIVYRLHRNWKSFFFQWARMHRYTGLELGSIHASQRIQSKAIQHVFFKKAIGTGTLYWQNFGKLLMLE